MTRIKFLVYKEKIKKMKCYITQRAKPVDM